MTPPRIVAFVTDFGTDDPYAGQMEAVVAVAAPHVRVVHITHGIPPHNVQVGAVVVAASARLLPAGTVLVAVVDPGVGTERRGLIVRAGERWLVGPDNGLLLGGEPPAGVWRLDRPDAWRRDPSSTFHGRDVFAPVAARLALYDRPDALGSPIDDPLPAPTRPAGEDASGTSGAVIYVDRFGNLITNVPERLAPVGTASCISIAGRQIDGIQRTYGDGQAPVALIGSWGLLEIAVPGASAAAALDAGAGTAVTVERR